MRLEGKLAVVTGAASGIGAAVAERFVAEGARVVGADIEEWAVRSRPEPGPGSLSGVRADVSDEASVVELVREAEGQGAVDILVNVAGIGSMTSVPDTPLAVWDRVLAVNARGTFLCCKHVLPAMASRGRGAIVNVASVAGLVGLRNRAAYCASKGAVVALTRALAIDHVGEGIRVNCLCPGTVETPWVHRLVSKADESLEELQARQPMGRLGRPAEIAEAALFLAEDTSAFTTGSVLVVDGGLTAA